MWIWFFLVARFMLIYFQMFLERCAWVLLHFRYNLHSALRLLPFTSMYLTIYFSFDFSGDSMLLSSWVFLKMWSIHFLLFCLKLLIVASWSMYLQRDSLQIVLGDWSIYSSLAGASHVSQPYKIIDSIQVLNSLTLVFL